MILEDLGEDVMPRRHIEVAYNDDNIARLRMISDSLLCVTRMPEGILALMVPMRVDEEDAFP
jgi:hypothetical protein